MAVDASIRKLEDDQVEDFDTEYVSGELRKIFNLHCEERFARDEKFKILDVGGGNGVFMDSMLEQFPNAEGVVLDNSQVLLDRNQSHSRKRLLLGSVEQIGELLPDEQFDLITFHWVLHHFVIGGYRDTRAMIEGVLDTAGEILCDNGRISVFENMYDGWLFTNLPGWIIYRLTSSARLAKITRRFGANTGGVGVCFRSHEGWQSLLESSGLRIVSYRDGHTFRKSIMRRYILHMGNVRNGQFWCERKDLG